MSEPLRSISMLVTSPRWLAGLDALVTRDYGQRYERPLKWMTNPLVVLILATIDSAVCGLCLHPLGFVLSIGLGALIVAAIAWPWLNVIGLGGRWNSGSRGSRCQPVVMSPSTIAPGSKIVPGMRFFPALHSTLNAAFIPVWDDWTRWLQVGTFLCKAQVGGYRRMKAKVFRDRLEVLKHAIEEGYRDETRELVQAVQKTYGRMRAAFLE